MRGRKHDYVQVGTENGNPICRNATMGYRHIWDGSWKFDFRRSPHNSFMICDDCLFRFGCFAPKLQMFSYSCMYCKFQRRECNRRNTLLFGLRKASFSKLQSRSHARSILSLWQLGQAVCRDHTWSFGANAINMCTELASMYVSDLSITSHKARSR